MKIGLDDIDPQIGQALADRLTAPPNEFLRENIAWGGLFSSWRLDPKNMTVKRRREPSPDERIAHKIRKQREEQMGLRIAGAIFLPLAAGALVDVALVGHFASLLPGVAVWLTGSGVGSWWATRAVPKTRLRHALHIEEMRAAFPLLSLTRTERIYCDTLLLLARMDVEPETERTLRETLRQLNDLIANSRQLEARRLSLLPVFGNNVIAELETEFGSLGQRLDRTQDPLARQALEQSLQMCANRLDTARNLAQSLERLNVQQEAIGHTIASAQAALARLQVAPSPRTEMAAQTISETVAQMNQQTYAVEQAVQEVITLGGA